MNQAFEARVYEVFSSEYFLPVDAPLKAVPQEIWKHGAVVVREAATRRRMALLHQGRYCDSCRTWYPITADELTCPHCGAVRQARIGSGYVAVARPAGTPGRGKLPVVHARVTEQWSRRGAKGFERLPGELLCRADSYMAAGTLERTGLKVSCATCAAKIQAHLGRRMEVDHA